MCSSLRSTEAHCHTYTHNRWIIWSENSKYTKQSEKSSSSNSDEKTPKANTETNKKRIFITYNGFKKTIHVPFSLFSFFEHRSLFSPSISFWADSLFFLAAAFTYFYFHLCAPCSVHVCFEFGFRWSCSVVLFTHSRHCAPFVLYTVFFTSSLYSILQSIFLFIFGVLYIFRLFPQW